MDKYRRVDKPKSEFSDIKENEIRITTQGKMRNYISYATNLLSDPVSTRARTFSPFLEEQELTSYLTIIEYEYLLYSRTSKPQE